jgi:hypothetical protein
MRPTLKQFEDHNTGENLECTGKGQNTRHEKPNLQHVSRLEHWTSFRENSIGTETWHEIRNRDQGKTEVSAQTRNTKPDNAQIRASHKRKINTTSKIQKQ